MNEPLNVPLTYEALTEELRRRVAEVTFTKADGTRRVLKCTLIKDVLPEQKDVEEYTKNINREAVAVWDLENNGWRSFRISSVLGIDWFEVK